MLLELHDLSRSLLRAGVSVGQTDNHLVPYRKQAAFQVCLKADGQVAGVHPMTPDALAQLRKYEVSKGGLRESAAGFNIACLFRPKQGEDENAYGKEVVAFQKALKNQAIRKREERAARLEQLLQRSVPNWEERGKAVDKCLAAASQVLLRRLTGVPDSGPLSGFCELLRRSMKLSAERLREALFDAARRAIEDANPNAASEQFLQLLVADKAMAVVLELAEAEQRGPINNALVWASINQHLLANGNEASPLLATNDTERDVFGGPLSDVNAKMPEVKLRRLGLVKLRSLAKSASCQERYGLIESATCPVGKEARDEMDTALRWISETDRQDMTWTDVSDSCGFDKKSTLLFAYPDKLPDLTERLSGFFARPAQEGLVLEKRYEEFARSVTERLRGLSKSDPGTLIRVFVLLKADTARTKLLCSRQYTVERVIAAAAEWQEAARNLPPIFIRQFTEVRGQTCWHAPLVPFPAEVVRCVNTAWQRSATHAEQVPGIDIGSGLSDCPIRGDFHKSLG
jgi:hypothetical protein